MTGRGHIDVNVVFGPVHGLAAGAPLELLRDQIDAYGPRLALARHRTALAFDPTTGNRATAAAAADPSSLLAPIGVVGPSRTLSLERQVADAVELGVVAFWLQDAISTTVPSAATDDLLTAIAATGRPLFVPVDHWGDATRIGAATADLGVPVVLVGAHYSHINDDLAAAVRFPHLHLETSALAHYQALETTVARLGAERVLFGSGSPERPAGSALGAVLAADLSDDDRRAILAGNAARLLGLSQDAVDLTPLPLPATDLVDVHCHIPPTPWGTPPIDSAAMMDRLRASGTRLAAASSVHSIVADLEAGNAAMVAACAEVAGLHGYVVVDPNDLRASREQLRRHISAPGVVGVKIHAEHSRCPTASTAMRDLFTLIGRFAPAVKIHNDGSHWDEAVVEYARAQPSLTIVIAHGGLGCPSVEGARAAAACDNVFVEFSSSFAHLPTVRRAAAIAGSDRILWGSDAPVLEPAYVMGSYRDAGLGDDAWARTATANAERALGLDGG